MSLCLAACSARVVAHDFGGEYLGVKYVNDPLGEGVGYDADPLIRDDAFDCLTYVETVLACGNVDRLNQIRYANGKISFENRNHFFTSDWLRNNADLVENISVDFGATTMRLGTVTKSNWFALMHGLSIDVAPTDIDLKYVPYSNIEKFDTDEPVLVAFVVNNPAQSHRVGSDILVAHVGFLLPGGVLRHASRDAGAVVDADFREYVARRALKTTNLGVAFFKIKRFCK